MPPSWLLLVVRCDTLWMVQGRPPSRPRLRSDALEWRQTGDEVVVLDLARSEYLLVNHSGAQLWGLLADGASVGEMAARLVERYGLGLGEAEADVELFLAALDQRRLLETHEQ